MQDLDKQLQGMKQNVTGTQIWDQSTTSYYQANGDDPYDYACGKHEADSFFNADGDVADLQKRIDGLIAQINRLNSDLSTKSARVTALDPLIQQAKYARDLKRILQAEQESKRIEVNTTIPNQIKELKAQIATYELAQEKYRVDEAKKVTDAENAKITAAKNETRKELAKQGLTPEAIESKLTAVAKSSGRNKAFLIGGSLALIAVFGFIFLRRRNG